MDSAVLFLRQERTFARKGQWPGTWPADSPTDTLELQFSGVEDVTTLEEIAAAACGATPGAQTFQFLLQVLVNLVKRSKSGVQIRYGGFARSHRTLSGVLFNTPCTGLILQVNVR
jgi:hypothetical protein